MRTIEAVWKGTSPLIMNSPRSVNTLDPLSKELKDLTAKRNKTEEDLRKISDLEWELSLYWDDCVGLYLPAENITKCIQQGGAVRRQGKKFETGFECEQMLNPLDIHETLTKEKMKLEYRFRDVRPQGMPRGGRVMRTRARFNMWSITFRAQYDETILDFDTVKTAMDYAGTRIGICDSRSRKYGRFAVVLTELD